MAQITKSTPQKSKTSQRLLLGNVSPRLAAVLFQQLHVGDRHAAVHGFAHVVNGHQGDLHGYINQQLSGTKCATWPNSRWFRWTKSGQNSTSAQSQFTLTAR
jgi:hypothetical protein